jgi:hypothetical protein
MVVMLRAAIKGAPNTVNADAVNACCTNFLLVDFIRKQLMILKK